MKEEKKSPIVVFVFGSPGSQVPTLEGGAFVRQSKVAGKLNSITVKKNDGNLVEYKYEDFKNFIVIKYETPEDWKKSINPKLLFRPIKDEEKEQ